MELPYTNAQKAVLADISPEKMVAFCRDCAKKARAAFDAVVPLPHTNEEGQAVFHGCNVNMHNIAMRYLSMAQPAYLYIGGAEQDRIVQEFKVSINGVRNLKKD